MVLHFSIPSRRMCQECRTHFLFKQLMRDLCDNVPVKQAYDDIDMNDYKDVILNYVLESYHNEWESDDYPSTQFLQKEYLDFLKKRYIEKTGLKHV